MVSLQLRSVLKSKPCQISHGALCPMFTPLNRVPTGKFNGVKNLPSTCPQCLPASARRWQVGFATRVSDSPEFRCPHFSAFRTSETGLRNSETGTRKRVGAKRTKFDTHVRRFPEGIGLRINVQMTNACTHWNLPILLIIRTQFWQ